MGFFYFCKNFNNEEIFQTGYDALPAACGDGQLRRQPGEL